MDAAGGTPRRPTSEQSEDIVPCYSRDGRSVYFASDRSGRREIWRIPAEGGTAVQLTRDGGQYGEESWDGRWFYYKGDASTTVLWRMPVGGGEAAEVLRGLESYNWWTVARGGIYYVSQRRILMHRTIETTVHYYDLATRRTSTVFTRTGPFQPGGLTVSPTRRGSSATSTRFRSPS